MQLFDLTPTEEQQMTRDVIQRFARDEIASVAREADEAAALPESFLQKTLDLGLNYMPVPAAFGGVGGPRSPISNVLNIEDLASGDMSMAAATLAPLSVINCVLDFGTEEQQRKVADTLLAEQFVPAALATMEPGLNFNIQDLDTTATLQSDGSYLLNGSKSMVAFGDEARILVVFAKLVDEAGNHQGTQGFVLESSVEGISFEREDYMGLRPLPLYSMTLDKVAVPATARLGDSFDPVRFSNLSKIAIAALTVGTCQAVLDYVVPYVNERTAFGEPISNRQSVAFMVADIATELEALRLMVYRAAAQAENDQDFGRMAYLAHRQAIKYGMKIGTDGIQLLGGHGFTREHPVELWYRNLRAIAMIDGLLMA